jgi:hypothetical protein
MRYDTNSKRVLPKRIEYNPDRRKETTDRQLEEEPNRID